MTPYSGTIIFPNFEALHAIASQDNFVNILNAKLQEAVLENKWNRFSFITHLVATVDNGYHDYQPVYLTMMDFVIKNFSKNTHTTNEQVIEVVLDLFWHQEKHLKDLNREGQLKLFSFLKITTGFKYEVSDYDEATFFAVNKSMDLIKYQNDYGDSRVLKNMFLNHFDIHIRNEAAEWIKD
ncbi:hypothetical protein [Flavobacterium rivuli]|uniref:hypothetical protein n=1 Tax=Flavobacterium rivuli TaxID=498301 RepID=UPI000AC44ADE|nr:hypothetical protein [Flavobacterium rivuli]